MAEGHDGSAPVRAGDRIRAAARELFYSRGFRGVGVDEIVARAGVTKPSLYRGFASKDALVVACLEDYDAGLRGRLDEALAAHPDDPQAGLLAFLDGIARRSARPGFRGCGLTNAVVEYPEADHPVRAAACEGKRMLHARLTEVAGTLGRRRPNASPTRCCCWSRGPSPAGRSSGSTGRTAR